MKNLRLTSAFKKDLKRVTKRKYDRALLEVIIDVLREAEPLRKRKPIPAWFRRAVPVRLR